MNKSNITHYFLSILLILYPSPTFSILNLLNFCLAQSDPIQNSSICSVPIGFHINTQLSLFQTYFNRRQVSYLISCKFPYCFHVMSLNGRGYCFSFLFYIRSNPSKSKQDKGQYLKKLMSMLNRPCLGQAQNKG